MIVLVAISISIYILANTALNINTIPIPIGSVFHANMKNLSYFILARKNPEIVTFFVR